MTDEPERKTIDQLTTSEHLERIQALRPIGGHYEMPPTEDVKQAERARQIADGTHDHGRDASPYEMTAEQHVERLQKRGRP